MFQDRCLQLVAAIMANDHQVELDVEQLELFELDGQEIKSILDWL